jgi:nicotinamide-nucleotide amidase
VFERGEVLPNGNGTAPGLWVEQDGKVLVMLPGPPNELQPMFIEQVVPRLAERGLLLQREAYVQLRTAGSWASRCWRRGCSRSSTNTATR